MYEHIIRAVFDAPWAITPDKYAAICEVIRIRAAGEHIPQAEIDAITAAAPRPVRAGGGSVAVIPVFGVISQRMNMMSAMSGGTSTEQLTRDIRQALADEAVGALVLNIDSPGGSVFGVPELADVIYGARGQKPIVAVANSLAASAAYWIASQADEFIVTPSGQVGSIGVLTSHEDVSVAAENEGVKVTYISAGKYKTEANPFEPLSDEAKAAIQAEVDTYYGMFVNAVARGRGVKASDVRGGFGEGRVVNAKSAVSMGMADRVATLDDTIARLMGGSRSRQRTAAEQIEPIITAEAVGVEPPEPDTAREGSDPDLELRRLRLRLQQSRG